MKKIYIILFALGLMSCFSSCKLEDRRYTGPLFIEFSPDQFGQSASPSGIVKTAPGVGQDQIGVQLIGLSQPEALTVNFRVADQVFYLISTDRYVVDLPDGLDPSQYRTVLATGKYNVDYTFDGLSGLSFDKTFGRGSFTIASKSQFASIPINILLKGGARFFFVLEDSDNLLANKPTALLRFLTPIDKIVLLDEPFFTDPFDRGWTEIDKDGDGYTWVFYGNPPSITSDSWDGDALFPENYLISPSITIPGDAQNVTLDFQVASGASNDYKEQYKVIISEQAITFDNCRDAEVLQDWTELVAANSGKKFTDVSIDMSAYRGKTVHIGILHGNCSDQYYILIRNLSVYTH
ncbi:MAG: choice-of-anchor J domain-containing protein [Prevotellaceae bacterium]|nr:choice-of-anchor J domain-containing protein [Prevotellaceae bacterium]